MKCVSSFSKARRSLESRVKSCLACPVSTQAWFKTSELTLAPEMPAFAHTQQSTGSVSTSKLELMDTAVNSVVCICKHQMQMLQARQVLTW